MTVIFSYRIRYMGFLAHFTLIRNLAFVENVQGTPYTKIIKWLQKRFLGSGEGGVWRQVEVKYIYIKGKARMRLVAFLARVYFD